MTSSNTGLTYTNSGKRAIKNMLATLPVPLETEYLPQTAKPGASMMNAATLNGVFRR